MTVAEELAEVFCLPDAPDEMLVTEPEPASRRLHLLDADTGEVHEDCPECLAHQFEIDLLKRDLDVARLKIGTLESELSGRRKVEPLAREVDEVLNFWREQTAGVLYGAARAGRMRAVISAGTKRPERVRARMKEGFTADRLKFAVIGALEDEWLMGANDRATRYDDVKTIFRDSEIVERLEREGWLASRRRQDLGADRMWAGSLERAVQNATLAELAPLPCFDAPGTFVCRCPNGEHRLTIAEEGSQGELRFTCDRHCELLSILDGLQLSTGDVGLVLDEEEADAIGDALEARIEALKAGA